MAKKRKNQRTVSQAESSDSGRQPSYWMIAAVIFFFFSVGLVVKMAFSPVSGIGCRFRKLSKLFEW